MSLMGAERSSSSDGEGCSQRASYRNSPGQHLRQVRITSKRVLRELALYFGGLLRAGLVIGLSIEYAS